MVKKVLALLCLVLAANAWAKQQLLACIDEFPPYQMLGEPPLGEHVAALEVLADKLARPLAFTTEPDFSHCLQRLKSGEADLIAGLIDKPARHEFLHMLPMRRESAYFFVTRSQGPVIEDYDDLHHHLIAVSKDYYYFPRFDQDPQLKKIAVDNVHIAYKLLLAGRVETLISSAENHAAILAAHPDLQDQLVVQPYQIELDRVIYFGLSRQSGHAKEIDTIRKKVNQAFNDNAFAKAMQEFAKRHPQYYQVMPPKLEASNR